MEELFEKYIRDNLTIEIIEDVDFMTGRDEVIVQLRLNDEVISKDWATLRS
jgi:hypothetical protein